MFKKIGISLLLAFTILMLKAVTTGYANPEVTCTTIAECRDLQRQAHDNIAEMIEQEEELRSEIEEIQEEIASLREEISDLEHTISAIEVEIEALDIEIAELSAEVALNLVILEETVNRIDELIDAISNRMRLAQRAYNRNSFLVMLSEAEDLTTFLRVTRGFGRIATSDARLMDELTDLVEFQENLILELSQQQEGFEAHREMRRMRMLTLETEQANLEAVQYTLEAHEIQMQDILSELHETRLSEEEMLAAAIEIREILERTPPPLITTPHASGAGVSSGVQTPNNSGLAHPMPGSRVTSEFGPRWGRHHAGIDLVVNGNPRANILAAASGTVTLSSYHASMGYWVILSHHIDGERVDTVYAHLRYTPPVSVGQAVLQGEVIGVKGNTGHSRGAHLHFEVHPGGWHPFTHSWQNRGVNPRGWVAF